MAKKKRQQNKSEKTTEILKLSDDEQKRLDAYLKRKKNVPVRFKLSKDSTTERPTIIAVDMKDPLGPTKMTEALGTPDGQLQTSLLNQAVSTFNGYHSTKGYNQDIALVACNNALSILNGIEPQDEIEGMLAVQMIGVHNMAMETLTRAMHKDQTFKGQQANVNQATKLNRTFIAQMDALKKHRTGGQQKMVVEHVHVNKGGQAIVGTVNQGGEGK